MYKRYKIIKSLIPQQSPNLELAAVFIMQFQAKAGFAGCKKRIIVGELINVAGDLHAVVVQKGRYDLIPGKGEIQLCLKEAQNGKGSKADDNLGADCLSNLFRRSCRHSAFGNGKGRFHVCIKF